MRASSWSTLGELVVRGEQPSHAHEGAHDLDVDGDGASLPRTVESMATPCSVKA